jgi:hypothetical protein
MHEWFSHDRALDGQAPATGFTAADMSRLEGAWRGGAQNRGWRHAQFAANDFSHYLAIWGEALAERTAPRLAIIRFAATGTYALMAGERIVVTGPTLETILPALAGVGGAL